MPAKRSISDCNVVVANAIAADHAKDYVVAMALYRTAIGILLQEMEQNKSLSVSKQHNTVLKTRVKELLHRAEELQRYLDNKSRRSIEETQRDRASSSLIKSQGKEMRQDQQLTATGANHNNHDDEEQAVKQKEWSFHFDLRFDMNSKIKTTNPSPEQGQEEEGGENKIMKLLRLLPMIGGQ